MAKQPANGTHIKHMLCRRMISRLILAHAIHFRLAGAMPLFASLIGLLLMTRWGAGIQKARVLYTCLIQIRIFSPAVGFLLQP